MNRVLLVPILAATLAAPPAPAAASTGQPAKAAPLPTARVRLVKGEGAGTAPWAAANLVSERHATLSTRLSAIVRDVPVEEGARVARGQLLVQLGDEDLRAALAAAEGALAAASAHERRLRDLLAQRAATPAELEQAEAQRAQAEAAVAAAKANLSYAALRAPFAGTIQSRKVNTGDLVGPGRPLVELEAGALEVQATLSESEAQGLAVGQKLAFESGGRRGEARITALAPGGDPLSHRRFLRARVLSSDPSLRSGAFARVALPSAAAAPREAWVPSSALVERGDLTGVFVVADGRAELRWISLGEPAGDRVPVRAGLKPGEAVVDAPGALRDGQPVEVARGE